jgi:putative two-component system response regulator
MLAESIHSAKILVIDDEPSHTRFMADVLRLDGYTRIKSLNDSRGSLSLFVEYQPDLIILDLNMPYLDGFQVLDFIRPLVGEALCLPILIVTAEASFEARTRALSSGAMDVILKPFLAQEVRLRVRNLLTVRFQQLALENQRRSLEIQKRDLEDEVIRRTCELEESQLELKEAQLEVVVRLARAAEQRDDGTGQHTQRVGLICSLLAQTMNLPESQITLLRRSALLHDVGKIGIPDAILLKPGRLTDTEHAVMQRHCAIGSGLLSGGHSQLVCMAERIALAHHERWDGTGYPQRLSGNDIPLEGRIVAVADVFDALSHERPYKAAWSMEQVVEEIAGQRERHFDPQVVDAFLSLPHHDLV